MIFYLVSLPIYYALFHHEKKKYQLKKIEKNDKKLFFGYIFILGLIYAITTILSTIAYASSTPVIVGLIMKLQLFIVVIISVVRKTDKMNVKKVISLLVGVVCIALMTFIS